MGETIVKLSDEKTITVEVLSNEEIAEKGLLTAKAIEEKYRIQHGAVKKALLQDKIKPAFANSRKNLYYTEKEAERFVTERKGNKKGTTSEKEKVETPKKVEPKSLDDIPVITREESKKEQTIVKEETTIQKILGRIKAIFKR